MVNGVRFEEFVCSLRAKESGDNNRSFTIFAGVDRDDRARAECSAFSAGAVYRAGAVYGADLSKRKSGGDRRALRILRRGVLDLFGCESDRCDDDRDDGRAGRGAVLS